MNRSSLALAASRISRSGDSGDMPRASGLLTPGQHNIPGEVITSKRGDSTTYCVSRSGYNRPEYNTSRVQVQPPLMRIETGVTGPIRDRRGTLAYGWFVWPCFSVLATSWLTPTCLTPPAFSLFYPNVLRSDKNEFT